ncbi:MAG TPA: nitroreductase family protein [Thermomicrobiales bacterium]|jgi:nitroreductase
MTILSLTNDELLATTRAVRKRLDLARPVEREILEECLQLAQQAPTGSNRQGWGFIVVTDPAKRLALAELYRKSWGPYSRSRSTAPEQADQATQARVADSASYLAEHMHEVPVLVVPVIRGRTDSAPIVAQAGVWGSILPAAWSFMLAARSRGLGTVWTTLHLRYEEEAAEVLGIPYAEVMQTALIPVAYTLGTAFKPGPRAPLDTIVHWEQW